MSRIAGRFELVLGLLSDLPLKNCWHLLGRAKREADQGRDDVRGYVVEHLHPRRRPPAHLVRLRRRHQARSLAGHYRRQAVQA
ncbi:hypothetical protein ACFWWB_23930 [Streptomyces sp. NPDC058690]|uniref:hypothetical protein n=1 Tax=Streptomyces sp. NPDC058690 TaxID=3346600 RepID=UPI00366A40BD